jgi:hypothetical protein
MAVAVVFAAAGCGDARDAKQPAGSSGGVDTNAPDTVVDHATGRSHVKAYKRVKTQLNDIQQKRNEDVREALD